ncbi:folate-binding protein YgfZ [Mycobacterium uberis]|uniref:Folate-binding protein YgfZ n=1 Tax=Mycobacterium uberis TaxID=2162698 RepID=A0A3E1HG70_9MYCO|nr:folate-binding protein YgfZ [Mycobacterium uberis]RFD25442.1 folate-binding protein YgfZ [Mycobacterium uberis]
MNAVPAPDPGPDAGAIWHFGDPLGEQRAAETDAVLVDLSHRAVLTLIGSDRQTWLHSISTQHVSELPDGASTQNLSLDGQGRVEDHWIQTELAGTTYLDTEPWRGEPLLKYLRKMVFWSEVTPGNADMAVLSLLGPRLNEPAVLNALHLDALPTQLTAVPLTSGGFVRRIHGTRADHIELNLLVPRRKSADWQHRLTEAGVRLAGVWTYEAHRVAALRPRLGVDTDQRTIPHEVGWIGGPGEGAVHLDKGCYRGQETVARVHNLGKPPRMLVLLHLDGSVERPSTGDPVLANNRTVGHLGTVVEHVDLGPVALALLKRGLPTETELVIEPESPGRGLVAAVIDADSLPAADEIGAGRQAVERLRKAAN